MTKLGPNQRYEIEIMTPEQRIARDPRGLLRVINIGETVLLKKIVELAPEAPSFSGDPIGLADELRGLAVESAIEPRDLGEEK